MIYIVLTVVFIGIFICGWKAGVVRGRIQEADLQDAARHAAAMRDIRRMREQLTGHAEQERV